MAFRVAPWWWPVLAVASPALVPWMMSKNRRFKENRDEVTRLNQDRMEAAKPLALPALEKLDLTVISEYEHEDGFMGEPGVSYLLRTDHGSLLYDIGFGVQGDTFLHNTSCLGVSMQDVDALAISHLHADHVSDIYTLRYAVYTAQREGLLERPIPIYMPKSPKKIYKFIRDTIKKQMPEIGIDLNTLEDQNTVFLTNFLIGVLGIIYAMLCKDYAVEGMVLPVFLYNTTIFLYSCR